MATITENFVSFEIAKLLKEKGFNEYCPLWYNLDKPIEGPFFYKEIGWYGHNSYDYEVQEFIKEYPEDYDDRVRLQVRHISALPSFIIRFDEHPYDIESIERYGNLFTFRDSTKAKWLEWNGKVKELQIEVAKLEKKHHKN